MAALDEQIAAGVSEHEDRPVLMLDRYLEALQTHLRLRSPGEILRVDERFGPVEVVITDADRVLLGVDRDVVRLSELAIDAGDALVEDLARLRGLLLDSSEDLR
jgi:hypothetical protein